MRPAFGASVSRNGTTGRKTESDEEQDRDENRVERRDRGEPDGGEEVVDPEKGGAEDPPNLREERAHQGRDAHRQSHPEGPEANPERYGGLVRQGGDDHRDCEEGDDDPARRDGAPARRTLAWHPIVGHATLNLAHALAGFFDAI